jgi:hypothetical protein
MLAVIRQLSACPGDVESGSPKDMRQRWNRRRCPRESDRALQIPLPATIAMRGGASPATSKSKSIDLRKN